MCRIKSSKIFFFGAYELNKETWLALEGTFKRVACTFIIIFENLDSRLFG